MTRSLQFAAIFLVALGATGIFMVGTAFAECGADGFCPLADVTGSKLAGLYSGPDGDLAAFISRIFGFALTIGGILAVARIAWGGYLYMVTDLWSSKERARETLRETVLGLMLLIAVWIILYQINPDILKLQISITPVTSLTPEQNASLQLYDENVGNPGVSQSDYIPSLSPTPIANYYCYLRPSVSPAQYACFTSESGCSQTASGAGATCSRY